MDIIVEKQTATRKFVSFLLPQINVTLPVFDRKLLDPVQYEYWSFITHAVGFVLSVFAIVYLIRSRVRSKNSQGPWDTLSIAIYGTSLVVLYAISSTMHGARAFGYLDDFSLSLLNFLDHAAIFLMIGGTYTPFVMRMMSVAAAEVSTAVGGTTHHRGHHDKHSKTKVLENPWFLVGLTWTCIVCGILVKLLVKMTRLSSTGVYLCMGWLLFLGGGRRVVDAMPKKSFTFLLLGGLAYSIGVIFFMWRTLPFNHAIWHVYVVIGSFFALPRDLSLLSHLAHQPAQKYFQL